MNEVSLIIMSIAAPEAVTATQTSMIPASTIPVCDRQEFDIYIYLHAHTHKM